MKRARLGLGLALCLLGCSSSPPAATQPEAGPREASAPAHHDASDAKPPPVKDASMSDGALPIPASCAGQLPPPSTLECTGLYADIASKTLAPEVRAYAPAIPLWADGAGKNRWIYLPPGQTIDRSDPEEWIFPVGTRIWKEFSKDGVRIETRMFEKLGPGSWAWGTYAWNAAETAATLSPGGPVPLPDGGTWNIPTFDECQKCHEGRTDYLLGFEEVSLGEDGAIGLTLAELANEKRLSPVPALTHLKIGDDGTGKAAAPLAWLHINCGTTCHNANPNALEAPLGMVLRLDPTKLDGGPVNGFPSLLTTVGVAARTPSFQGQMRIVPSNPQASLLHQLIDERGSVQMPPFATSIVDTPDVELVADWIAAMPPLPDAGHDGGTDASVGTDGTAPDATSVDAQAQDAGALDSAVATDGADAGVRDAAEGGGG